MTQSTPPLTYAASGVDIDAGEALVQSIKPAAASTRRPGVMGGLGGFGALFDLKAAGFKDPILVAATDGVGTKLKLAIETGIYAGVGVDLVAMCVNDLLCQGAEPLFFLDYYATGHLDPRDAAQVVEGVAEGCRQAGCALIGGETAEMPGMYARGDFDLAGFSVGALERGAALPLPSAPGDALIGLASSGVHSNGFSLVRKVVDRAGLSLDAPAPFAETALGEALLTPTRIYVKPGLKLIRAGGVRALAHVTGGGITDNLPRVLPEGMGAEVDLSAFDAPAVFSWIAETGQVAQAEMLRAFNCGVGLIAVVPQERVSDALALLEAEGERAAVIGRVTDQPGVTYSGKLFG